MEEWKRNCMVVLHCYWTLLGFFFPYENVTRISLHQPHSALSCFHSSWRESWKVDGGRAVGSFSLPELHLWLMTALSSQELLRGKHFHREVHFWSVLWGVGSALLRDCKKHQQCKLRTWFTNLPDLAGEALGQKEYLYRLVEAIRRLWIEWHSCYSKNGFRYIKLGTMWCSWPDESAVLSFA